MSTAIVDAPATTTLKYNEAMGQALAEEMRRDDTVFVMGQDVATLGGSFGATKGLAEEFGIARVRNTAINEAFMVGCAAGAAMVGMRPVVDLVFGDFALIAGDEIFHKLAKWRYMHGGVFTMPAVILLPFGIMGGAGPEHSASLEVLGMHFPGLKVAIPSTAADAKGLLKTAIRDPNPVLFHPVKALGFKSGPVPTDPDVTIPFGQAAIRRTGSTITTITYGSMVDPCLKAADQLAGDGIELEVIDLRTLVPLDLDTIIDSVRRTNRAMIVHEACRTAGPAAEIIAQIQDVAFYDLESPIGRVTGYDVPIPQNGELEARCIPNADRIAAGARELIAR